MKQKKTRLLATVAPYRRLIAVAASLMAILLAGPFFGFDLIDMSNAALAWFEATTGHTDWGLLAEAVPAVGAAGAAANQNGDGTGGDAGTGDAPAPNSNAPPDQRTVQAAVDYIMQNPQYRAELGLGNTDTTPAGGDGGAPTNQDIPTAQEPAQRTRAGAPALAPAGAVVVGEPVVARLLGTGRLNLTREQFNLYRQSYKAFRGMALRQPALVETAGQELLRINAYPDIDTRDGYSTLVSEDGGLLLPTEIEQEIVRLTEQHGIIRRYSTPLPAPRGKRRWPRITESLVMLAVGEGNEIKARKAQLGSIETDPDSWGLIVFLTKELDDEAGAILMPVIIERIAEAEGFAEDNAGFNGDGSAAFNGITGIRNAAGVQVWQPVAGNSITEPGKLNAFDFSKMKFKCNFRGRNGAAYHFHPDFEQFLEGLKDDNNRPVYKMPADTEGTPTLWGKPVRYSSTLPDPAGLNPGDDFGVFGNLRYGAFSEKGGMEVMQLDQATILDIDDATPINLATRNMKASRVVVYFDYELSGINDVFVVLRLAAT